MILRCTKKLLAILGAGRVAEPGPTPDAGDWYASLLWSGRRKCLLPFAAITPGDIRRCGERDRESLRQRAAHAGPIADGTLLYRMEFHLAGPPEC